MRLKRIPVHFAEETLVAVDALSQRYAKETKTTASRGGLLRILVERGLASIDLARPIAEQLVLAELARERSPVHRGGPSLRLRVLELITAHPEEVYWPARLAPMMGANKDSVRNALLVLAANGRIEKVGLGQYRARRSAPEQRAEEAHP